MRDKNGHKLPNPIEPHPCLKCGGVGMRYQGRRTRAKGYAYVYKCIHCKRNTSDPGVDKTIVKKMKETDERQNPSVYRHNFSWAGAVEVTRPLIQRDIDRIKFLQQVWL